MLADISGFTSLAERLARDNTGGEGRGTEQLSRMLNSYFGRMIDMIYEGGGDVVKFAGDALLVVWRKREEDEEEDEKEDKEEKEEKDKDKDKDEENRVEKEAVSAVPSKRRGSLSTRRASFILPTDMSGIVDARTGKCRRTSMSMQSVPSGGEEGDVLSRRTSQSRRGSAAVVVIGDESTVLSKRRSQRRRRTTCEGEAGVFFFKHLSVWSMFE